MKNIISALLVLLVTTISFSQSKHYTMEEAVLGLSSNLALKSIKQPGWQPGTHNFYQVKEKNNHPYLIKTSYPDGRTTAITSLSHLNRHLKKDSVNKLPSIHWINKNHFYINTGKKLIKGIVQEASINWKDWVVLPENAANITVHETEQVAYTRENNLWLVDKNAVTHQITNEKNKHIISGQAVHRNEFGITGGIFFSPAGNYLAYYKMDESMVADYPIIRWNTTPAKVENIKYPMAGTTSHEVQLCVYHPATRKTTVLRTGLPKDQYLTSVTWSPDEKYIYIAIVNRDQNHVWLNQYDAQTGAKTKTLFEEISKTYIEPQHPLYFIDGNSHQFIWWSEEDGYPHLYLYNTDGSLIRQLTKGEYEVNEISGYNKNTRELIILSAKESPLEKNIYAVNIDHGVMRRIDKEKGTHSVIASDDGKFLLDIFTEANTPKKYNILSTENDYYKNILTADNTLSPYKRPIIESVRLNADDGTLLYGRLIYPTNFNSSKKYPVIVYLYNGPHVQLIKNKFPESGNLWYEYLAQHGYVVFIMDGRGSENRGRKFEQATFRKLGTVEMEDQLKGVEYLKSLPFVDAQRMGVHGWSYGGFMTTSFMLRHPGVFKVGVAGGPVMDWKMYEIMYTERYMDTPQDNEEGYENANLLSKTKNLKGKLLLIHGTDDNVVVWQHSINFLKKAVEENVQVDYFVYPGYEHNVRGKDRVHLMQKITDYFDLYLK